MEGTALIAQERLRQVAQEGWTAEHDDDHGDGQLIEVAADILDENDDDWGLRHKHKSDRIRQLVIAGALIAAEIDRLQRLERPVDSGVFVSILSGADRMTIPHLMNCPHSGDGWCLACVQTLEAEAAELREALLRIRENLESIVCTGGCDAGVVLLSQEGRTHTEVIDSKACQVYDLEYFSPLGEALIELYKLAGGTVDE